MCYCPTPTLHLNLALTGDGAFLFSLKKTHSVWFISVLNYGDTENVLINHLLLVIPMSYPCHYTNLCPHKPHKHAHTHTHTCSVRSAQEMAVWLQETLLINSRATHTTSSSWSNINTLLSPSQAFTSVLHLTSSSELYFNIWAFSIKTSQLFVPD